MSGQSITLYDKFEGSTHILFSTDAVGAGGCLLHAAMNRVLMLILKKREKNSICIILASFIKSLNHDALCAKFFDILVKRLIVPFLCTFCGIDSEKHHTF